jgi:hypothetical protein
MFYFQDSASRPMAPHVEQALYRDVLEKDEGGGTGIVDDDEKFLCADRSLKVLKDFEDGEAEMSEKGFNGCPSARIQRRHREGHRDGSRVLYCFACDKAFFIMQTHSA